MKILTKEILAQFKKQVPGGRYNLPVIKLFGGSSCTWLLSEYDEENKMFFGLCDLGLGEPELGYISYEELLEIRFPPFGLPVERDRYFKANKTLEEYATEAREKRRIL